MRRAALVLLALNVAFGGLAADAFGASGRHVRHRARRAPECRDRPGRPVTANDQARLYIHDFGYEACIYGSRRTTFVDPVGTDSQLKSDETTFGVQLAGTLVASEQGGSGELEIGYGISVVSLRTSRVVRQLDTGVPSATQTAAAGSTHLSGVGPTTTVVLRPDGAVAWIVHDILAPDPPSYQVWKADAGGAPTMLATANDIDPASLALAGSTVYWSEGGAAHAATLS